MKTLRISAGLLLMASLLAWLLPMGILAQDLKPELISQAEKLELKAEHTKLEGVSGESFEFEVFVKFTGSEARTFDLSAVGPQDWGVSISPSYPRDKKIQDIRLEPDLGQTVVVKIETPYWLTPEPGTYDTDFKVSNQELSESLTLKVVITARYSLRLEPPDGLYNTVVQSGRDNFYTLSVRNTGTAVINNITFSKSKPSEWVIEFSPEKVDALKADQDQTVEVNIKPPAKTISGDYKISLRAYGNEARASEIDVRVTVETPSVWGWTGVGIIILVVAGLGFVIMRFGRR